MSLLKDFTDDAGNVVSAAYWRAVVINIASAELKIRAVFYGFKDASAFQAGKASLLGAVKVYEVEGAEFIGIASQAPSGSTLNEVLANAVEEYALNKLDTPSGQVNPDGSPVLVSFFNGATRV